MNLFRLRDFENQFEALRYLQNNMNDFFGDLSPFYRDMRITNRSVFPSVNIFEKDDDHIVIKCELPGIKKEDIDISIKEKMLTLTGKRDIKKDPEKYGYVRKERPDGKFSRTFELPYLVKTENTNAGYEKGILTIELEKADAAKSRKISIS